MIMAQINTFVRKINNIKYLGPRQNIMNYKSCREFYLQLSQIDIVCELSINIALCQLGRFELFLKFCIPMLKGLYDTDCSTFSPQGKLFQVEYAMEAVKQGSICLGLRSNTHVVLCSLKRLPSDLAGYQEKMFKVDDNIGMAMSGLTADARVLCKYMRNECVNHRFTFETSHPLNRLLFKIAESKPIVDIVEAQYKTQNYSMRPYGVGLLVAGVDSEGPHLFETCPSGNYYEYHAFAIGARSQSAKTYLENNLAKYPLCHLDNLILHGLSALKKSASEEGEITEKSVQIGIVGKDSFFRMLKTEEIGSYLKQAKTFNPEGQMEESA